MIDEKCIFKVTFSDKFSSDKCLNSDKIRYKQLRYLQAAHQDFSVKIQSFFV